MAPKTAQKVELRWESPQTDIAGNGRFGYLGNRRVAVVQEGGVHARRTWILIMHLAGPKGIIPMEAGFPSRDAAQSRGQSLTLEFLADIEKIIGG